MSTINLIPIDETEIPFPFFSDEFSQIHSDKDYIPDEAYYKVYNDGSHYVATLAYRSQIKPKACPHTLEAIDILFDGFYSTAMQHGLKDTKKAKPLTEYIKAGMQKEYGDYIGLNDYIEKRLKRKANNFCHRTKRFRRKAYINRWSHFVSFTYDDKKHTEESFRKKLRKCLSNLHTRRGWRYMGVFERAPESGRLHFHGLMYIPDGQMIGKVTERKDYSTAQGKMQITHPNSFFEDNFGRSDFAEVNEMELKHGNAVDYLLKYISKTGERIVYSRGIATEVCLKLKASEVLTTMLDYVKKFVLFDDTLSWERDIMHYKPKQMTMLDLLCQQSA